MARKNCTACNIRKGTDVNGFSFKDMCDPCYQEGGWENTHSDGDHEGIIAGTVIYGTTTHKTEAEFEAWLKEEREGCWICYPELNLAQKPAKATGPKVQGTRRPQLNHKGHSHPQTAKARRVCKAAFWSSLTPVSNTSTTEQLAAAMQAWNFTCDAQGVIPAKKETTEWTVAPRGPKGGVINQLKAAKPAKGKFLTKAEGQKLYGNAK